MAPISHFISFVALATILFLEGSYGLDLKPKLPSVNVRAIPAALAGALLAFQPINADALTSGSRSGGSSFRSTRSYSAPSTRSYSSSYRSGSSFAPSYYPVPVAPIYPSFYSPFGFGGFIMPVNFNLVFFAFASLALYTFLSNRVGSSNFEGLTGSTENVSVIKLQLALNADWSDQNNIMSILSQIAGKYGSTRDRSALASLLSETSLCLLRKQSDWHSSSVESLPFKGDIEGAEQKFQRMAIKERSKFEMETSPSYSGLIRESPSTISPTLAVVSVLVAVRGQRSIGTNLGRSYGEVREVLQNLAADALVDDGDNVMAVEILWTPDNPKTKLNEREVLEEYPELLKF